MLEPVLRSPALRRSIQLLRSAAAGATGTSMAWTTAVPMRPPPEELTAGAMGAGVASGFFRKKLNIGRLLGSHDSMKQLLHRLLVAFAFAAFVPTASFAQAAAAPQVQQFTLGNGMTVIVKPDHRAPTAVQMVWV